MSEDSKTLMFCIAGLIFVCITYRCVAVSTHEDCTKTGGQYVNSTWGFGCLYPNTEDAATKGE